LFTKYKEAMINASPKRTAKIITNWLFELNIIN